MPWMFGVMPWKRSTGRLPAGGPQGPICGLYAVQQGVGEQFHRSTHRWRNILKHIWVRHSTTMQGPIGSSMASGCTAPSKPVLGHSFVGRPVTCCGRVQSRRPSLRQQAQPQAVADLVKSVTGAGNGKVKGSGKGIAKEVQEKIAYDIGTSAEVSDKLAYRGTALSVRQRLIDAFNKTQKYWRCAACLPSDLRCSKPRIPAYPLNSRHEDM